MSIQDQNNEKCVCLIIKGGSLSAKALALAMQIFLAEGKRLHKVATIHHGKQTVKQLSKQGATLTNIEIKDENIKSFERIARKYGIDFALKRDASEKPARYLVFFKSKDAESMTAAFHEFSAKQLGKSSPKPSIMQTLQKMVEKVKNQVLDQTKHKDRGLDR